jgi:hypothetical protein
VKDVLRVFHAEIPAREKDDLKEDPIVIKLRKVCQFGIHVIPELIKVIQAGGASYDGV